MKNLLCLALVSGLAHALVAAPRVEFVASSSSVTCYDFFEVRMDVANSSAANPFAEVAITATFGQPGQAPQALAGFCDSADGRVHRIRLMPSLPGTYTFTVTYREGEFTVSHEGTFEATDGRTRGPVRADPDYPGHFRHDGTQERFFWSGIPAQHLVATDGDAVLRQRIATLDQARITGLLLAVPGCTAACGTAVEKTFAPDPAEWQRLERVVTEARKRDMAVAVVLAPAKDKPELVRYTAARLAAFRNVIWDCGPTSSDCASDKPSTPAACPLISQHDPYGHLASIPSRAGSAATTTVAAVAGTHDSASVDDAVWRAWQVCLSGGYPTHDALFATSGSAEADAASALEPFGHLYDLFTGVTWWELQPESRLVLSLAPHPKAAVGTAGTIQTLASRNSEGNLAVIYVRGGGVVTINSDLIKDQLKPLWFSPRDGGMRNARALRSRVYRTPTAEDWVLLFRTPCNCSFRDFDNEFEN